MGKRDTKFQSLKPEIVNARRVDAKEEIEREFAEATSKRAAFAALEAIEKVAVSFAEGLTEQARRSFWNALGDMASDRRELLSDEY